VIDDYDYTLDDLLETARSDAGFEPDAEKREKMIDQLKEVLTNI